MSSQKQSVNSRAATITPSNYFSNTYNRNIHKIIGTGINDSVGLEAFDAKNNEMVKPNIIFLNPDSNYINNGDIIEKNIYEQENRNMQATIIEKEIALEPRSNIKQTLELNQNFDNHSGFTKNLLQPQNKLEITQKTNPNRENPKLVIGKINVEIIPSNQPMTKII